MQSATAANHDSNKALNKDQKFNFGKCKVCKDKATGIHYGIPSCEGCKGFYKRSVNKHHKYVCYFGSKCTVTPRQRRRCKLCRWNLCVAAGMSFDSIKMGRISRVEKEKVKKIIDLDIPPDPNKEHSNGKISSKNNEKLVLAVMSPEQMRLTKELSEKCYLAYIEYSKDIIEIYQRAIDCLKINKPEPLPVDRIDQTTIQLIWQQCLFKMSENVKDTVLYIKSLPGFNQLDIADLATLFEEHTATLLEIKGTRSFIGGEIFFLITHNVRITRSLVARLMGVTIQEKIFKFYERFNNLGFNDREMALLMPTIMTHIPDGMVLKHPNRVNQLHEQYKQAITIEFLANNRTDDFIQELIETMKSAPMRKNIPCQNPNG